MSVSILCGDCRDTLRQMPDESVHCCISSPPYWSLRDYGTAKWEGGDAACDHRESKPSRRAAATAASTLDGGKGNIHLSHQFNGDCGHCGAIRIDSQIGLEPDFRTYVATMVEVFREVRRVLRKDGTLWLNLGDSYAGGRTGRYDGYNPTRANGSTSHKAFETSNNRDVPEGLKPKDLCGIPWKVAQALQEPYYTGKMKNVQDRIWLAAMIDAEGCIFIHKRKAGGNHDTFTKKDGAVSQYQRQRDMYGSGLEVSNTSRTIVERCMAIAGIGSICEQSPEQNHRRKQKIYRWNVRSNECRWILQEVYPHLIAKQHQARLAIGCPSFGDEGDKAHTSLMALHNGEAATLDFPAPAAMFEPGFYLRQDIIWAKKNCMPESVTDRCTKAHEYLFLLAKSERYYYDAEAIKEASNFPEGPWGGRNPRPGIDVNGGGQASRSNFGKNLATRNKRSVWEVSTQPFSEAHFATFPPALIEPCIKAGCPIGGTVLDPFAGAGTTGLVADRLQRNAVLIELNPTYADMSQRRIKDDAPLFAEVDDYNATDDFARSIDEAYRVIRERKAAGGKGWGGWE